MVAYTYMLIMNNNIGSNKKIAKNTIALYIRMIIILVITLYTSRVVLKTLGISDYGIYNIVGGIIVLFSFINNALANATQRFLNFEIGENNNNALLDVFNSSLYAHLFIIIGIFILGETIGLWFVNSQLNIPVKRKDAAILTYQISIITFCINVWIVPFDSAILADDTSLQYVEKTSVAKTQ